MQLISTAMPHTSNNARINFFHIQNAISSIVIQCPILKKITHMLSVLPSFLLMLKQNKSFDLTVTQSEVAPSNFFYLQEGKLKSFYLIFN